MSNEAAPVAPAVATVSRLDHPTWCRWWRGLIVERYRVTAFDDVVPLFEGGGPTWVRRVALGRLVDASLAGSYGAGSTAWLVADALDVAGFGDVGHLAASPRRGAPDRLRSWAPARLGNEELHFGVVGSVADALLAEVPPLGDVDLRQPSSADRVGRDEPSALEAIVVRATRAAVLGYAARVEELAVRARSSVASTAFATLHAC